MDHIEEKPRICSTCFSVFESDYLLKYHSLTCNEKKQHVCEICHVLLTDESKIIEHKLLYHPDDGEKLINNEQYSLDVAGKLTGSTKTCSDSEVKTKLKCKNESDEMDVEQQVSDLEVNARRESTCGDFEDEKQAETDHTASSIVENDKKPHACGICFLAFTDLESYTAHMESHTSENLHQCYFCNLLFSNESDLQDHSKTHKQVEIVVKTDIGSFSVKRPKRKITPKPHHCQVCGKSFRSNYHLRRHGNIHSTDKQFENLILPPNNSKKTKHPCKICGKIFYNKNHNERHMTVHSGEKRFKCDICHKSFSDECYKNKHRRMHNKDDHIPCEICNKTFFCKDGLASHMLIHTGEKTHLCTICGKAFLRRNHLNDHVKIHSGEKPHVCDQCGKAFTCKSDLTKHFKRVHSEVRPFQCAECGKSFALKSQFTMHVARHDTKKMKRGEKAKYNDGKIHECDVCDRKFPHKVFLNQHKAKHVKSHSCSYCGKKFYSNNHLKQHLPMHTGEKNFVCKDCGKSFGHNSSLANHKRKSCPNKMTKLDEVSD